MRLVLVLSALIALGRPATAFVVPLYTKQSTSSSLPAKVGKKKKKKTATTSSSGGFGVSAPQTKENDYAAFPALETSVADTLLEAPKDWATQSGELPAEVYDRLNQIYGFSKFNYETQTTTESSLTDLLSVPQSSSSSSNDLLSGTSNNDMADLLSIATGDTQKQTSTPTYSSISKLPPFPDMRILHVDPMVLAVDNFFTDEECDNYVNMVNAPANTKSNDAPFQSRSKTVGKDALAKSQRTSTTWFNHYKTVPELMSKASRLVGLDTIDRWEEPQIVRYRRNEKFTWHLDALAPTEATKELGGQRIATLLVYLTDLNEKEGGATMFRDLGGEEKYLRVQPEKGMALLFFPSAGGIPNAPFDVRTLHCGEAVSSDSAQDKWISQLWLREFPYNPTAPAGNSHANAESAIDKYCTKGQ